MDTPSNLFDLLEETFRSDGSDAVFDTLIHNAREEKNYREMFSVRLMQVRHRLGLPLLETDAGPDITDAQRPVYEKTATEAARETGTLFLSDGDIAAAWPYFRAIGEREPVAKAIESIDGGENVDRAIEIAFQEGVHPRKGFELLLKHHGTCRAITWFGSLQDSAIRQECLRLLVRTLYRELGDSLKQTVASAESIQPSTDSVAELIAGRDWLFEGNSYYVDSSHVMSVLQFAPELTDEPTLRLTIEMAEYGQKLAPMFHFRSDPPFEDTYSDYAVYLKALLGEDADAGIEHFREKARQAAESGDLRPAEVLIVLLVRLGRYQDAIGASLEFLPDPQSPSQNSPSAIQLCQMAGDYERLRAVARERGDVLSFAAGVVQAKG